jgi:transposase
MARRSCSSCQQLRRRVAELEAIVHELRAQLGRNAANSSQPPSADPPGAPKPVTKVPTGKKPGGQPGHPPLLRHRLPPERVARVVPFVPDCCGRCRSPLPGGPRPEDPAPRWHQVAELPPVAAVVTEYQAHGRTCQRCGHLTWAEIPAEVRAHSVGPELTAALAYLRGAHRVSLRGCEEIAADVFGVPVALGTLAHLERETSAALEAPHAEALGAVRAADSKCVDETSWKVAGKLTWLWVAATARVAAFVIHARRGLHGLRALLGEAVHGIVCSDRWSAYGAVDLLDRQVCWAHLKRDFRKCADRGGPAAAVGRAGLRVVRGVFACWHRHRDGPGPLDRDQLMQDLRPWQRRLERALREGSGCADGKAAAFCDNLLELWPALWLFGLAPGVEPTNNHAERMLRAGVLWRKVAQGSRSAAGCRFVERVLTAVQTLRLQGRPVLGYLQAALRAHRQGSSAPSLLPTG